MLSIVIESFGPFASRYEVEVKPLTLLIGRNSLGKSMIAYLAWTLAITTPDFNTLFKVFEENGGRRHVQELLEGIEAWKPRRVKSALKNAISILAEKALPQALAHSLEKLLPKVYGRKLGRIVTRGHRKALIETKGLKGEGFRFIIDADKEIVRAEASDHVAELMTNAIDSLVKVDEERGVLVVGDETWSTERIRTVVDLYSELSKLLGIAMGSVFEPPLFAAKEMAALLVDSRAGVLRTLLRPYTAMLSETLFPDQAFIAYYYMFAERLAGSGLENLLDPAKELMKELGFELELRLEGGVYNIYVRMWSGETIPITLAPSGIRESVALIASLTVPGAPLLVVLEEPEAHLHPRAQVLLADLIAQVAASKRKWVIATTHSDYIVYELNNKIMESSDGAKNGLAHDNVAAYLVRREGVEAIIERIPVSSKGIPEDEFAHIAEELAIRRGFLTLRS